MSLDSRMANLNVNRIHGFTIVEIVVVICVVGIIGAVGYVWWRGQDTPRSIADQVINRKIAMPTASPIGASEQWGTYTNVAHGYSFHYPISWEIKRGLSVDAGTPLDHADEIIVGAKNNNNDNFTIGTILSSWECVFPSDESASEAQRPMTGYVVAVGGRSISGHEFCGIVVQSKDIHGKELSLWLPTTLPYSTTMQRVLDSFTGLSFSPAVQ